MKILLMCMGGFSTGLLVEKMMKVAKEKGEEAEVKAVGSTGLDAVINDYQCLLLAPQVSYMEEELRKKYPKYPIYVIEPSDYGRLNADKIMQKAKEVMEKGDDKNEQK